MARLSSPPTSTPKTERKSNRLRNIFKHRPSNSASGSPAATSNPTQEGSSPVPSPTVRPGFQQIGLLPNERSVPSLHDLQDQEWSEATGKSLAEFIQEDELMHRGVSIPRGLDTNLYVSGETQANNVPNRLSDFQEVGKEDSMKLWLEKAMLKHHDEKKGDNVGTVEKSISSSYAPTSFHESVPQDSSLPLSSSHKIMGAMHDMSSSPLTNQKPSLVHASSPTSEIFHMNTTDSEDEKTAKERVKGYEDTRTRRTNEHLKSKQGSFNLRPTVHETVTNEDGDGGPVKQTNRSRQVYGNSPTDLEARNFSTNPGNSHFNFPQNSISNNGSSLPQDLQEFIANEIASALKDRIETTPGGPAGVTLHIKVPSFASLPKVTAPITPNKPIFFHGPKNIGFFAITNMRMAQGIQLAVIAVYCLILLNAALLGPKSLLLALWRMVIVLAVYLMVLRILERYGDVMQDVLIAPVVYAGVEFQKVLEASF